MAPKTILLIDDDDTVIEVGRELLNLLGYEVLVAKTGTEALVLVSSHPGAIDLALLDYFLPDLKGSELFPQLRAVRPELKVIICTGYSIDDSIRALLRQGAVGFLQKPFPLDQLREKIETALAL